MPDFFSKVRDSFFSTAETIGKKSMDLANQGKLRVEILRLESKVDDTKKELGEVIFDAYLTDSELDGAKINGLCEEIKNLLQTISQLKKICQKKQAMVKKYSLLNPVPTVEKRSQEM